MKYPIILVRGLLFAPSAALLCLAPTASAEDRKPVLVESKRIWDKARYNSFTDLTRFRDQWFCCFREGIAHTADIGKLLIGNWIFRGIGSGRGLRGGFR